ncbi:MAG: sulfotransferase [Caldilineaceae bacterium]
MSLPTFLVAGAMKSGTTAIYQYLIQHPEVYLSPDCKESRFLTGLSPETDPEICARIPVVTSLAAYSALFQNAKPAQRIGEVDPWCLVLYDRAIPRIQQYLTAESRIIIFLRNPVDRAYSNYYQGARQEFMTRTFKQIIADVESGHPVDWYERLILEAGNYFEAIRAYLSTFGTDRVKIILYDEFRNAPMHIYKEICAFIEVDETFIPDMSYTANKGGIPRSKALHRFLTQKTIVTQVLRPFAPVNFRRKLRYYLINRNLKTYPSLDTELRMLLTDYYRTDVEQLQQLLNRDLSGWLQLPLVEVTERV